MGDGVSGWNPLLASLLHLSEKLEEFGIVYAEGKAVYAESAEVRNVQFIVPRLHPGRLSSTLQNAETFYPRTH